MHKWKLATQTSSAYEQKYCFGNIIDAITNKTKHKTFRNDTHILVHGDKFNEEK